MWVRCSCIHSSVALTMTARLSHQVGLLVGRNRGTQNCKELWETESLSE